MKVLFLTLFLACSQGEERSLPDAEARVELDGRKVAVGAPAKVELTIVEKDGFKVEISDPASEGLTTTLQEETTEQVGAHKITRKTFQLSGDPGSYVIATGDAKVTRPDGTEEKSPEAPLFVDIGVDGPSSTLEDIVALQAPPKPRWPWFVLGGAGILLLGTGIWLYLRARRPVPVVPPDPPDVVARRRWAALAGQTLDDHGRALEASEIFRAYLVAVHGFPARSWTTSEILEHLEHKALVGVGLRQDARTLLWATDLLKFARKGGGSDFFQDLDRAFDTYLRATRPPTPTPGS